MIARPEFESPAEIDTVSARVWEKTVATNSSHTDVPKMNILDDFLQNSFPKWQKIRHAIVIQLLNMKEFVE